MSSQIVHPLQKELLLGYLESAAPMCHASMQQLVKLKEQLSYLEIKYLTRILVSNGE